MSFDARSRERLEALGRTLPSKLPLPATAPASSPGVADPAASSPPLRPGRSAEASPRHRLETEQNPEALFHALIQASPDGTVPPHHLDRLRSLEDQRLRPAAVPAATAAASPPGSGGRARRRQRSGSGSAQRRSDGPEQDLYAAFEDLLRLQEDDEGPVSPPPARRPPDDRLLPRPTLRARSDRP